MNTTYTINYTGLSCGCYLCLTQSTRSSVCFSSHGCITRMIRGWQLSRHLTQPLTLRPLQQALRQCVSEILHSDQGVQYLSNDYIATLTYYGIEISLAQLIEGCPWENGYAERLIRTLKEKEVHLNDYEDIAGANTRIGHFIDQVYNNKQLHSALVYLIPIEFENVYLF